MIQTINSNVSKDWPNVDIFFNKKIELFIDSTFGLNLTTDSLKVLWVKESGIISQFYSEAISNCNNFHIILTYDEEILKNCDNSYFMPFGSTWIQNFDLNFSKKFNVSHLTGFKLITDGHKLRHDVHNFQDKIKIPKNFFVSHLGGPTPLEGNSVLYDSKNPLFESQFHICIENSRQKNFFTEKLIDCLITKTIPIFWGCENIDKFFNPEGFYFVKSLEDIIHVCNNLDENIYFKKIKHVEENYQKALEYSDLRNNFKKTLENILKNGNFI